MSACLTCGNHDRGIQPGMRVTLSDWEQVWIGKTMSGTIDKVWTASREALVRWDNGHKDRRWPVGMLYPLGAAPGEG